MKNENETKIYIVEYKDEESVDHLIEVYFNREKALASYEKRKKIMFDENENEKKMEVDEKQENYKTTKDYYDSRYLYFKEEEMETVIYLD